MAVIVLLGTLHVGRSPTFLVSLILLLRDFYFNTTKAGTPPTIFKISNPTCSGSLAGGPFTLTGTKTPAKHAARAGKSLKMSFVLTRWADAYPSEPARRELAGLGHVNKTKVWENYDVLITLPGQGVALKGKPRVAPRIRKRKGGANVADNTLIAWDAVPMLVQQGAKKNYTRKFSFAVKVDKTFVGDLTFAAAAAGPKAGWLRQATVTVPVVARK